MEKRFTKEALFMAEALNDKNGLDILLIDVEELTIVAKTFIIASGRSVPHVKSLCDALEEKNKEISILHLRKEGYRQGRWIVLDYGEILVHIFHKDERGFYNLERLWIDGNNYIEYA